MAGECKYVTLMLICTGLGSLGCAHRQWPHLHFIILIVLLGMKCYFHQRGGNTLPALWNGHFWW